MKKTSAAPSRIATIPAMYAHWSPDRNDVFAAAVIWSAYFGYCCATASAPANDFVSWASTLSETFCASGEAAIAAVNGRRVAGRQQRAEDRLHDRAAEVALEIGGARRHPRALDRAPSP